MDSVNTAETAVASVDRTPERAPRRSTTAEDSRDRSSSILRGVRVAEMINKLTIAALIASANAFTMPNSNVFDSKVAAAVAAAVITFAAAPAFADSKAAGQGQSVFSANCAACHAGGKNVILPYKNLQLEVSAQPAIPRHSECVVMHGTHTARAHRALRSTSTAVPTRRL